MRAITHGVVQCALGWAAEATWGGRGRLDSNCGADGRHAVDACRAKSSSMSSKSSWRLRSAVVATGKDLLIQRSNGGFSRPRNAENLRMQPEIFLDNANTRAGPREYDYRRHKPKRIVNRRKTLRRVVIGTRPIFLARRKLGGQHPLALQANYACAIYCDMNSSHVHEAVVILEIANDSASLRYIQLHRQVQRTLACACRPMPPPTRAQGRFIPILSGPPCSARRRAILRSPTSPV